MEVLALLLCLTAAIAGGYRAGHYDGSGQKERDRTTVLCPGDKATFTKDGLVSIERKK